MVESQTRAELQGNIVRFFTAGLEGSVDITIQRTYRTPDDYMSHGLPPGLGAFPMLKVADVASGLPPAMVEKGGVLIPVHEFEAMWFSFSGRHFRPSALQILAGKVNAVSGRLWDALMTRPPNQDYVVIGGPQGGQPWLDGWRTDGGVVRQFVAAVMGKGQTVEFQVTGKETEGGVQLLLVEARHNAFPVEGPMSRGLGGLESFSYSAGGGDGLLGGGGLESFSLNSGPVAAMPKGLGGTRGLGEVRYRGGAHQPAALPQQAMMGLGAGGKITQNIYPDPYGDVWDSSLRQQMWIHMVNPAFWQQVTGQPCPTSPITPVYYRNKGWWGQASVWFQLHDGHKGDVGSDGQLSGVQSVQQINQQQGGGHVPQQTGPETPATTVHLGTSQPNPNKIAPGKF